MIMCIEDVDWERQAKHFLEKHGWEFDEHGLGTHELFPLAEDFSMGRYVRFCKSMYEGVWNSYRAYIHGTVILNEIEEVDSDGDSDN